jgi:hypothetical protein
MLGKLNNLDKHRLLLVIVCVPNVDNMWWGLDEGDPSPDVHINWAPLKNGSPVAWFDFHGAEPPAHFDAHPALQVTLNERDTPRLPLADVSNTLGTFVWWVEHHIVGRWFRGLFL